MKKNYWSLSFQVTLTVITFAIIYLPILVILLMSIHGSQYNFEKFSFTLRWYQAIFTDRQLVDAIIVTLQIATLSTLLATTFGTLFAIGIHSLRKKGRLRMMVLNNMPVVNPDIVTGILMFMIFRFLRISFGFPTMLLAHVFFSIPFVILSVLPKLKQLDPNIFDAALDLGATKFQAIIKVILPSIKVGVIAGALIAFTMSIDDFIISYFMKQGEFHNVSTLIYSRLGKRQISPNIFAYNSLIVFLTIGIMVTFNRLNRNPKKIMEREKK
ncbi:MAG: ABC transporter permease [Candidatus Izemoplasmatales bacterium]|nr:ABC transporter permease [Candidatus Izemoplasmatales bacterium]